MTISDPNESQDLDSEEESPSKLRRELGRKAAEADDLRKQLAERDRDLAFTKVGLPDTPMAEFFRANYTGDNSEEAIRAHAAELGLIGSPSQQAQESAAAIQDMSEVQTGATMVMPADRQAEMEAKLRALPPGPNYASNVERVLQEYGRPTAIDET